MRCFGFKKLGISFNAAGLIGFFAWRFNFHLIVRPSDWVWIYNYDWFDGDIHSFGFGPLFLIVYSEY